eukprot:ANDGO_07817.mRNA.1 hypothetical protein
MRDPFLESPYASTSQSPVDGNVEWRNTPAAFSLPFRLQTLAAVVFLLAAPRLIFDFANVNDFLGINGTSATRVAAIMYICVLCCLTVVVFVRSFLREKVPRMRIGKYLLWFIGRMLVTIVINAVAGVTFFVDDRIAQGCCSYADAIFVIASSLEFYKLNFAESATSNSFHRWFVLFSAMYQMLYALVDVVASYFVTFPYYYDGNRVASGVVIISHILCIGFRFDLAWGSLRKLTTPGKRVFPSYLVVRDTDARALHEELYSVSS